MFGKTRIRLTALNTAVFFVILACLGVIVYTELRHQLYAKVDESLRMRLQQDLPPLQTKLGLFTTGEPSALPEGRSAKTIIHIQGIDPRIFLVFWDEQGNPFPTLAGADLRKAMDVFRPYLSVRTPQTIKVGGHSYRIYAADYDSSKAVNLMLVPDLPRFMEGSEDAEPPVLTEAPSQIVSVQAIGIVDSEENMLKQLSRLILFGILGGGAVTILAGYYLANRALLPIRRSWERQQQFVADASHELRMPLSIIQANTELVFRHPDRSILEMSEPLSMVLGESKRMGKLTEQLLTLARADSNQEEIVLKPITLEEVIREVVLKFKPLAEFKGQVLELRMESGLDIMGDRERLHQLLVILVDNSMKFTPDKGTIRVLAHRTGHYVEIVVEDTGCGIEPEDLPHIFDRFYRGDKARNRSSGGTGLGLAIAQWIAAKHGGDLTAASIPGLGTTMTLRLAARQKK